MTAAEANWRTQREPLAASIVVAALNNVFPRVTHGRWRIAFAFGLLHGFGFASVLAEMGLPAGTRLVSLLAFNPAVEVGQLAVVLAIMPLAFLARCWPQSGWRSVRPDEHMS